MRVLYVWDWRRKPSDDIIERQEEVGVDGWFNKLGDRCIFPVQFSSVFVSMTTTINEPSVDYCYQIVIDQKTFVI